MDEYQGMKWNKPLDSNGGTIMHVAVGNNDAEAVLSIASKHPSLVNKMDKYNTSPLQMAVRFNRVPIVNILLDRKAKIDTKDEDGDSPVMEALDIGSLELVNILLDRGASLSRKDAQKFADENGEYYPFIIEMMERRKIIKKGK